MWFAFGLLLLRDVVRYASELEKVGKICHDLGGWKGLKSGNWLLELIPRSYRAYP